MSDVISTRLDKKEIEELNNIAEEERLDRSALIRKFILAQIMEYRMKNMGEKYRKGLVSLAEAATLARVSIYDMMDYIQREKIQPAELSDQELKENLADADRIFNTTMNKHKSKN